MSSGGLRKNAGRPHGTGLYKEKTVPIRVPLALEPHIRTILNFYLENYVKCSKELPDISNFF